MIIALQTLIFFRESLLSILERLVGPYYRRLTFNKYSSDEEEDEEEVFADFDDEKGVVFFPPVYAQRYAAVSDCLMDERWRGKLEKVVDLGYHDMSFIKYLKEVPGVKYILGVDVETLPIQCTSDLCVGDDYAPKRESPLRITLFQGNAADPDYRLIGCDAVVAIEMIEHMLPHDLDRLVHTVFGFVKPRIAVFTTPNADFNVLFKALEKNGLRRCDHFFEWTREQFHDWCSNIVVRYPNYTVTTQGVGPGPPGTQHYGCCSQLALFVSKNYVKQPGLSLESLALISRMPSTNYVGDLIASCVQIESNPELRESRDQVDTFTDFLYNTGCENSCVSIVIAPSTISLPPLEYSDKTSQCDLDIEVSKNFLMFNYEDMCFTILVPRRKTDSKVYDIEDVASRLNCTTFQARKFSKTTQSLLARNKIDSLIHTREVVDEIRNLTKKLNFNRFAAPNSSGDGNYLWKNTNWGDNAPYWNQYYKTVRDYNYPFEEKSDESRIVDLISEEINSLIDVQSDELRTLDMNRVEIPLEKLMRVVCHITTDVDKVKNILEWNGYEIVGNMVIHSRIPIEENSVDSCEEDWAENDTSTFVSDFDTTDIQSNSTDAASTLTADHHDKASTNVIRRALDKKVHALREMLVVDEDITTELDRVVCRLMSLAIKTSKRKQTPPPAKWMQCKLLDLLTLTEKAITKRKTNIIQSSTKTSVGHAEIKEFLQGQKVDDTANSIVSKYNHLINAVEVREHYDPFDFQFYDELGVQEYFEVLRDFESSDPKISQHLVGQQELNVKAGELKGNNVDWIGADDTEIDTYTGYNTEPLKSSAGTSKREGCNRYNNVDNLDAEIKVEKTNRKRSFHKTIDHKLKREDKHRSKKSKPNMVKKIGLHKNPSFAVGKKLSFEYGNIALKPKKLKEISSKIRDATAKPIPDDLIKLCRKDFPESYVHDMPVHKESTLSDVSATQPPILADTVTDEKKEKSALWRSVGIDTRADERKKVTESVKGSTQDPSQSIFLYDINEPSTSKGLRHVSMDVQCGTDPISPSCGSLAPPSSLTKIPNIFTNGIKISDSLTNISSKKKNQDFESSTTNDISNFRPVGSKLQSSHIFTKGIKIGDSSEKIDLLNESADLGTSTDFDREIEFVKPTRTTKIRIKDSLTELRAKTSTDFGTSTHNTDSLYLEHSHTVGNNTCRRLRAWSPVKRHIGIKIKDSTMDFLSKNDSDFAECPEDYAKATKLQVSKDRDSLSNLLVNFTCSQDHDCQTSRSSSPILRNYEKKDFGTSTKNDVSEEDNEVELKTIKAFPEADNTTNESYVKDHAITIDNAILRHDLRNDRYHLSPPNTHDAITNSPDVNLSIKKLGSSTKDSDLDAKKKVEFLENVSNVKSKPIIKKGLVEFLTDNTSTQPILLRGEDEFKDIDKPDNSMVGEKMNAVYLTVSKQPKLSRGGVHIHSYNEKQTCEDIVYLGEWQSQVPKVPGKRPLVYRTQKKRIEMKHDSDSKIPKCLTKRHCSKKTSKEIVHIQKQERKLEKKLDIAKKVFARNTIKMEHRKPLPTSVVAFRVKSRSLTKVSSKLGSSSFIGKNIKAMRAPITRSANVINSIPTKSKLQTCVDKVEPTKVKKSLRKNYVPSYLKKMKALVNESCVEQTSDINNSGSGMKKGLEENIKADLVKFQHKAPVNYVVFRNELDNPDNNRGQSTDNIKVNTNKKSPVPRSSSPLSVTSSCSSLDSAETVKNVSNWSKNSAKKASNVPHKNGLGNIERESSIPIRNKKFTKRCKTRMVKGVSKSENKENIPESSRKCGTDREGLQNAKSTFTQRNKNIFMAQYATTGSGLALNTKHSAPHKSSIKIPAIEGVETKKPKNTNKKSLQSQDSSCNEDLISENNFSEEDNRIVFTNSLPLETHNDQPSTAVELPESAKPEDYKLPECFDRGNVTNDRVIITAANPTSTHTSVSTTVRQMLEERLDFISNTPEDNQDLDDSSSVKSYRTIVPNDLESELDSMFQSEYENCSFDAIAGDESSVSDGRKIRTTDLDFLSFKTTAMSSKQSEYFLADSTYHTTNMENSVRDIFERKDIFQNPVGSIVVQAFSGFSIDTEPMIGDQPDFSNLIDSETGSINANFARQINASEPIPAQAQPLSVFPIPDTTGMQPDYINFVDSETASLAFGVFRSITSEELYLSSRSSESYNSCFIDEDAVVPNWLFNVISRQQSADAEETRPDMIPLPMPMSEPVYDVNGNMLETGVGLGAGAGDGRGIHSDHSQDSSGRGSSLTSTESSSGQQSEGAILIDPIAFTAQYEMFHEPNSGEMPVPAIVVRIDSDEEPTRRPGNETNTVQMLNFQMLGPSDGEADVSSIDTDIHDSSDN